MSSTPSPLPGEANGFNPDPELSSTLPARYLYDPEIFAREKEAIFYRSWQYAGHRELVANSGDYITRQIADESIIIMRGEDGVVRGFYNVCSHRAHPLLEGGGNTKSIVCPYHAWTYHTDGSLRFARNSDKVKGFDKAEFCLEQVRVEVLLGFLFVNLDPEAPSLESETGSLADEIRAFSPRFDELTLSHRHGYDIKANWKNLIENYSECYHCPKSHPGFVNNVVDIGSYRITLHDFHHSHSARSKPPADAAYELDTGASEHAEEFGGWYLWPNVAIEVYPGGCLNVLHIVPMEPERSMQYVEWYFYAPQPTKEQAEVIEYLHNTVRREDQVICERVQRGLRSRAYHQGRFIVDPERSDASEHAVHHFQSLVWRAVHAQ